MSTLIYRATVTFEASADKPEEAAEKLAALNQIGAVGPVKANAKKAEKKDS